jgi:hypothetical protein
VAAVQRLSAATETHLFFQLSPLLAAAVLAVTQQVAQLEGPAAPAAAAAQIQQQAALGQQVKVLQVVLAHPH